MHFSTSLSLTDENWLRHVLEGRSREDTGGHDSGTVVDCREDRYCRIDGGFVVSCGLLMANKIHKRRHHRLMEVI